MGFVHGVVRVWRVAVPCAPPYPPCSHGASVNRKPSEVAIQPRHGSCWIKRTVVACRTSYDARLGSGRCVQKRVGCLALGLPRLPGPILNVLPQDRNCIELQCAKDKRPKGFAGIVLIQANSRVEELYCASQKAQPQQGWCIVLHRC